MQVANLDTTDSSQYCPSEFTSPRRTCGKLNPRYVSAIPWSGVFKSVWESDWLPFMQHQMHLYHFNQAITIVSHYVDGMSVTHGQSPREHIWTLQQLLMRVLVTDTDVLVLKDIVHSLEQYHHLLAMTISVTLVQVDLSAVPCEQSTLEWTGMWLSK